VAWARYRFDREWHARQIALGRVLLWPRGLRFLVDGFELVEDLLELVVFEGCSVLTNGRPGVAVRLEEAAPLGVRFPRPTWSVSEFAVACTKSLKRGEELCRGALGGFGEFGDVGLLFIHGILRVEVLVDGGDYGGPGIAVSSEKSCASVSAIARDFSRLCRSGWDWNVRYQGGICYLDMSRNAWLPESKG
jgi:hypothetical protein